MVVFPNCKINLGLHVIRKRTDGYHDLETVFFPVALTDMLEIVSYREAERSASIPFSLSGLALEGDATSNICLKAYRLLRRDFPQIPHICMHLHKIVPSGAGLGGGSSDASFTLKLLNQLFDLKLSRQELLGYALELGSDCPFFIINKPCLASSRGELLEEISLDLSAYDLVLVNPGIHINTGDAFRELKPQLPEVALREIISHSPETWKYHLGNDFEKVIFPKYREIVDIKDALYLQGATYASMSGSGSTVFGLFPKDAQFRNAFPSHYFVSKTSIGQG